MPLYKMLVVTKTERGFSVDRYAVAAETREEALVKVDRPSADSIIVTQVHDDLWMLGSTRCSAVEIAMLESAPHTTIHERSVHD